MIILIVFLYLASKFLHHDEKALGRFEPVEYLYHTGHICHLRRGILKVVTTLVCGMSLLFEFVFAVYLCLKTFCLLLTPYLLHKSHLQWNLPICSLLDYLGFVHLFHCNLTQKDIQLGFQTWFPNIHLGKTSHVLDKICCKNYTRFANGTGV